MGAETQLHFLREVLIESALVTSRDFAGNVLREIAGVSMVFARSEAGFHAMRVSTIVDGVGVMRLAAVVQPTQEAVEFRNIIVDAVDSADGRDCTSAAWAGLFNGFLGVTTLKGGKE